MIRRIALFFVFALAAFATARFCHHKTKGFAMTKVIGNLFDEPFTPSFSFEEERLAQNILKQKFKLFGRGKESFAFLSSDGKYVLKIFKNQSHRNIESYQIAATELKEESGLLYMHLNKTQEFNQKVVLIDNLNIAHTLDLDSTAFAIQKKADLIFPTLLALRQKNDLKGAQEALSELLSLIAKRCQKGISDHDPLIRCNFGFVGRQAMHIDLGPFAHDATLKEAKNCHKEIEKIVSMRLRSWITREYPELVSHLDSELKNLDN